MYLTTPEGIKFAAFLFSLSVPFVKEIHAAVKKALPKLTPKQAQGGLPDVLLRCLKPRKFQYLSN